MAAAEKSLKEKMQDLEQENLDANFPSSRKLPEITETARTFNGPIDLTTDDTESEERSKDRSTTPEALRTSLSPSHSTGTEPSSDKHTSKEPDGDNDEGGPSGDDSDLLREEEAAVETVTAKPSPSPTPRPTSSLTNSNSTDVKVEDVNDNYLLCPNPPSQLTMDHLDVIYHIESSVVFCRLCV